MRKNTMKCLEKTRKNRNWKNKWALKKEQTDDGTFYGSLYDLYVLIGIAKGVNNINHGKGISLEELDKEMEALHYCLKSKKQ